METLDFNVRVSKDELLEFLNEHAQDKVDVYGQLPEDESIQINVTMKSFYSDVEFNLSYESE